MCQKASTWTPRWYPALPRPADRIDRLTLDQTVPADQRCLSRRAVRQQLRTPCASPGQRRLIRRWPGRDKDFPLPYEITELPFFKPLASSIFGPDRKAIPAVPNGPLYTWRNYNSIGAPGEVVATSRDGRPFTTAADEVTDIHELARSLAEQTLDFAEQYFPTKIATDISQAGPRRSAHPPDPSRRHRGKPDHQPARRQGPGRCARNCSLREHADCPRLPPPRCDYRCARAEQRQT